MTSETKLRCALLSAYLLVWTSQASSQNTTAWWGTVGSGGTVNIGDESNVLFDGPTVSVKPGTSAKILYNVDHQSPGGCTGFALRVRYRDEFNQATPQPGGRVALVGANGLSVSFWQHQIVGGGTTRIGLYESDLSPAKPGFQTMTSTVFIPATLDFSANVYWIEVLLDNRNRAPVSIPLAPGLPPAVSGIQIIAYSCIS